MNRYFDENQAIQIDRENGYSFASQQRSHNETQLMSVFYPVSQTNETEEKDNRSLLIHPAELKSGLVNTS